MKRRLMWAILTIVAATAMSHAQGNAARIALEAAKKTEVVDGDLKGAIERYKKIVSTAGVDRAVAAEALIRMADCHQKLGGAESRKLYERVIREFADQKEFATLAHARLGNTSSSAATMTSRRVATVPVGGIGYGTVSPDGRYFPFTNWNNGDLYLRDLVAGTDGRLTYANAISEASSQFAVQSAFSRDGRQIAYSWMNGRRAELRIIDASGPIAPPRTLYTSDGLQGIWPDDWSPDGRHLAIQLRRHDKTAQLGIVNVADGALRALKSVEWRAATRLMFSPDGKYLAYDVPASDTGNQRDVFILAADGSRDVPAVVHPANDIVMGWSADGRRLLFASDRSGGAMGLWQITVADGRPASPAELIKPNLEGAPLGVTKNGGLYSLMHHPSFSSALSANVQIASLDFDTGKFLSAPTSAVQNFVGTNNFPTWSPDGRSLAYLSARDEAASSAGLGAHTLVIGIRSAETGQTRDLRPALPLNLYPAPAVRWSADGRSLLTHAQDPKGRSGIFRIDAQTGAVSAILMSPDDGPLRWPAESPDGRHLYYLHGYVGNTDRPFRLVDRDLASGAERDIVRSPQENELQVLLNIFTPSLSPDGQQIVLYAENRPEKVSALLAVSVHGGAPASVIRVTSPQRVTLQSWTPDSRAVLVKISAPGRESEVWRVPLDGGERRKLDLKVDNMTPFSLHPDGRQVAYGLTEPAKPQEVWVLENFLPAPTTKPSARR